MTQGKFSVISRRLRDLCLMFGVLLLILLSPYAAMAGWETECADCPHQFSDMGPGSLALDADMLPHVAYGGDNLYYAYYDGVSWQTETVDNGKGVGEFTSLVLDSSGRPHISYYDRINKNLKYAWYDGASWQIETVDSGTGVGKYTSLALDSSGKPHISYAGAGLKYAYYDGVSWQIETVDAGYKGHTSLKLDSSDRPHISYYEYPVDSRVDPSYLKYAWYDGASWQTETVDSGTGVGKYSSLALDSSGKPHIAYDGRYARYDGSSWQIETVGGEYTSLALDSSDKAHISYYDAANADLKYTWYDGYTWQTETVDDGGSVGEYTSLALDSSDKAHISYYDAANADLKYTRYDGSNWQTETVDDGGSVGKYTSLALDPSGMAHISYYDAVNADLKYTRYDGSNWQTETVDSGGSVGEYTSLALDSSGRPNISYYDRTNEEIKYAWYDGISWHTETVDNAMVVLSVYCRFTSLALDSSGRPHISYCGDNSLKYARYDGVSWQIETVDSAGWVHDASLAIDSSDRPHISYQETTTDALKYAYHDGVSWQIAIVDSGGSAGKYSSLALDSSDRPHISYYNDIGNDLKYAYNDGSVFWRIETVDSAGDVGIYTSLAIDSSDRPHISYTYFDDFLEEFKSLKYAYNDGVAWRIETVDSGGIVGGYTSLALDSSGSPNISYYDLTNGDLKYAYYVSDTVVPDIKANGSDGPVTITTNDTLSITVELSPGSHDGEDADWWVLAKTAYGWYHYSAATQSWQAGFSVSYQGTLREVAVRELLNRQIQSAGDYTFYFAVDTNMNGTVDKDALYYDSVAVEVTKK